MESTFSRSVGKAPSAHNSTFDRDGYLSELNNAYESITTFNQVKEETVRKNKICADSNVDYCILKPHELFAGYTVDKPTPCKRLPNMPRDLEGCCSAESSHYVGRSYNRVVQMIKLENWEELFDFCYNSCIQIIRELYRETSIDNAYMDADIPLFLEHGVVKGILSYPEFYEIMSLVKVAEKRNVVPKYMYRVGECKYIGLKFAEN